ncbi:hypothetical protein IFM89_039272 [Coptis chinensis]|uniref:Exostosin GT47 domain-containing protein n=1 Tax=Coptis chinensis TaxID=261450 RepID=A0A835M8S9_9MAGN|nr:hypothetical protein IFM89_039272 [Coptis chinensis]
MEDMAQFKKLLCQVEPRRLIVFIGIMAFSVLVLQTLTLNIDSLAYLFPDSRILLEEYSSLHIPVLRDPKLIDSSMVGEVDNFAELSSIWEELEDDSETKGRVVRDLKNNFETENVWELDLDELDMTGGAEGESPRKEVSELNRNIVQVPENRSAIERGHEPEHVISTMQDEPTSVSDNEAPFQLQIGSSITNESVVTNKTTIEKMLISHLPPKSVMTISEMNSLLLRRRASASKLKPQWSTVRDQQLLSARLQIMNAPITRNDQELYAPLYRNVSTFKSTRMLEFSLYAPNSHDRTNLAAYLRSYTNMIAAKYSFWNRTGGADHFFVACHDWAPYETRHHMERCIKSMCSADVTQGFKIGKDVSLPETYVHSARNPLRDVGGEPPSNRSILAFFAGSMHGYLRPILLSHWENKDPDMKIFSRMPFGVASKMNYILHMKTSKYCICAKGFEVNSPRVVEAIFYECVPVIISDNFVPPFFDVLNWDVFSVIIAEKDIPNLKEILLSIPYEKYIAMQLAVKKVQRHFLWHPKPVKYDLFHMTLHSIWNSRVFMLKPK